MRPNIWGGRDGLRRWRTDPQTDRNRQSGGGVNRISLDELATSTPSPRACSATQATTDAGMSSMLYVPFASCGSTTCSPRASAARAVALTHIRREQPADTIRQSPAGLSGLVDGAGRSVVLQVGDEGTSPSRSDQQAGAAAQAPAAAAQLHPRPNVDGLIPAARVYVTQSHTSAAVSSRAACRFQHPD